jgi:hypothetical protein
LLNSFAVRFYVFGYCDGGLIARFATNLKGVYDLTRLLACEVDDGDGAKKSKTAIVVLVLGKQGQDSRLFLKVDSLDIALEWKAAFDPLVIS